MPPKRGAAKGNRGFETDHEVWISFAHKIRSASLGADFQSVFELKVAEHVVGDTIITQKTLSLLAEGASLDAKDDSAADAHWVATAAEETHAAMVTAIGNLTAGVKKKRRLAYYLLCTATSEHARLYDTDPSDPMFIWSALAHKFDPMTPRVLDIFVTRYQSFSIGHTRHAIEGKGPSFSAVLPEF